MNKIIKNLLYGFGAELLLLPMSIILPRIILLSFGSEVNGLTATITQIFTYIALLEAGIGNASRNCLYKNIACEDRTGISTTVCATRKYFRRIVPVYAACVVLFAVVYPLAVDTEVPARTIRLIILIQGLSGVINFSFTNTYTQLLVSDGRSYVSSNLNLMVKAVSFALQILLIGLGFNIICVQLSLLVAYILNAILIYRYVKREYPWLTKVPDADIGILSQRNAFVIHEISTVIFQSTDVFIISAFCSLKEASVYSIYYMVFSTLSRISGVLFRGIDFKLGAQYHRDLNEYTRMHDLYETLIICFEFSLISAAFVVVLPFVRLYTDGVTDINYIMPVLPVLFSLNQMLSSGRGVASKLITISGGAKDTIKNTVTETVINLTTSLILVNIVGMPGVLLGTTAALLYRTNDMLWYANRKVLGRKPWQAYKTLLVNLALFALVVVFTFKCPLLITNYLQFFLKGALTLAVTLTVYAGVNVITDSNLRNFCLQTGKRVIKKISR